MVYDEVAPILKIVLISAFKVVTFVNCYLLVNRPARAINYVLFRWTCDIFSNGRIYRVNQRIPMSEYKQ